MTGFGDWLIDTFIYTGLLIALVLLLRRPVSRWCGPQVAYALWALPFLRFVMPPIVLPAWMAPEPGAAASAAGEPLMVIISDPAADGAAVPAATLAPEVGVMVSDLLFPLWIGGALVFLGWRVREYMAMRRDLLAGSVPVGDAGKVRLVETPAVSGPVAFGIVDKVVALPPEFMAHYDITARDMAIAHELAHHRGLDLVANIAAQPLLALHWFNPLAWWGWRAMRRDQEAACDARVVAGRAQPERAAYARVIAGFATGDHLALAAPMACPVLGEKSIIHRLRSLTMSEVSSRRRGLGIAAITTTALALPLTASITYAQAEAPQVPEAPAAPQPPQVPLAPAAPQPPAAPSIESVDPDSEYVTVHLDEETGERHVIRQRWSRDGSPMSEAEIEAMREQIEVEMELREEEMERVVERAMAQVERAEAIRERGLEQAEAAREQIERARERSSHARERTAHARAVAARVPQVEFDCDEAGVSGVIERDLGNGRKATIICETDSHERLAQESARFSMEAAIAGLRAAMEALRGNEMIPAGEREEALRGMREAIRELESETRSLRRSQANAGSSAQASAAAVAFEWHGRMVSPIQVVPAVRLRVPTPVTDLDCEDASLPKLRTAHV